MEDILRVGVTPVDAHRSYFRNTPIDALSVGDIMSGMSVSFQEILGEVSLIQPHLSRSNLTKLTRIMMKRERTFFTGMWFLFLGILLMVFT